MCTPGVAVPCLCDAGQGREMPMHHRLLPRANSCRALCPNSTSPTLRHPTSDTRPTFHPHPTRFPSLTRLTFHHSPDALSIPLSFPHWPSPILATFLSMACVLKRFPLTSPRKLAPTCVKRGFLRTPEPHGTSQLSHVHPGVAMPVHAVPGSDVPCPCTTAPSASPARELLPCPVSQPSTPTLRNPTSHSSRTFHPHPTRFLLLSRLTFPHSPDSLSIHLSFPHWPSPILAPFPSMACVLKRFPLTSPRKLSLPCVKRGFLRTAGSH